MFVRGEASGVEDSRNLKDYLTSNLGKLSGVLSSFMPMIDRNEGTQKDASYVNNKNTIFEALKERLNLQKEKQLENGKFNDSPLLAKSHFMNLLSLKKR